MKARVPYKYQQTTHGSHMRSVAAVVLLTAKILYENKISSRVIQEWIKSMNDVYAGIIQGNNTWADEIQDWAEKRHIYVPADATISLLDTEPMSGYALQLLLLVELWTLGQIGFGGIRLRRYLQQMPFGVTQHYTLNVLTNWASSKKIHIK